MRWQARCVLQRNDVLRFKILLQAFMLFDRLLKHRLKDCAFTKLFMK